MQVRKIHTDDRRDMNGIKGRRSLSEGCHDSGAKRKTNERGLLSTAELDTIDTLGEVTCPAEETENVLKRDRPSIR